MKIFCSQYEDLILNDDTAFGNRLLYWVHCYTLSNLIRESKIVISYKAWPESLLLNFPNTISKKFSKSDKENSLPITEDQYRYILQTKDISFLDNKKNYYLDLPAFEYWDENLLFFYGTRSTLEKHYNESVSKIKLKIDDADEFFKTQFKDVCWVHIRRGNGTQVTKEFLEETRENFSPQKYTSYWANYNFNRNIRDPLYKTTTDKVYFNLLDDIVKNKNKKIYISSDIEPQYFSHYVERYGDNVIVRDDIFKKFLKFYKEEFFIKQKFNPSNVNTLQLLYNIFDLFVGINSDIVVVSDSSWGRMPRLYYKKKNYIWLHGDNIYESNIDL